jgi:hypothetical protein
MSPQTETKAGSGFKAGVKDYRLTYYTPAEKVTRSIFLVILLLMQEVCEWLIVLGSGSLVGCED